MTMKALSYHSLLTINDSASKNMRFLSSSKYALNREDKFSTERRSKSRELSQEKESIINKWFEASRITIETMMNTSTKIEKMKRLLYIFRKCFAESVRDIKTIDIIEHSIDLKLNVKSVKSSLLKYTAQEREFVNVIFSAMKNVGIIVRRSSA